MSLKILLVGINARYTHSNLAIRYLRNAIHDLNYEVEIAEYSINQHLLDILQNIYFRKPDVIGFSVYIWNSELLKHLLPEIKKILPECKLILGGPEVSYNHEEWISAFSTVDNIITGHGEAGFRFMAENNFLWNDKIISKPNPLFSEIPFPFFEADFLELEHKYIYYESSRGCSFRCSYCLSSRSDQKLEFRSIEQVKTELNWLLQKKTKIIKFVDRTFNIKPDFARDIWNFLIELKTETIFHFEIHPAFLEDEDYEILQNCPEAHFQFEIGIQSTNPQTLQAIHRTQNWEKVKSNILKLKNIGNIHLHVDLIAGLPFEDKTSLINSFNDIILLEADHFQLGFLKVLPGTEMQEKAIEFGLVSQQSPPYRILKNRWLSFEELTEFEQIEKLVNSVYNSENFQMIYSQLIKEFKSPFDLFQALLKFCQEQNLDMNKRDWQSVAKLLLEFVNTKLNLKIEFYLDILRWDWCQIAAGHHYPDFLNSTETKEWKRNGIESLRSGKSEIEKKLKTKLQASQINRTIFFQPNSNEFRQEMNLTDSIYAFVPIGKKKCIIRLSAFHHADHQDGDL